MDEAGRGKYKQKHGQRKRVMLSMFGGRILWKTREEATNQVAIPKEYHNTETVMDKRNGKYPEPDNSKKHIYLRTENPHTTSVMSERGPYRDDDELARFIREYSILNYQYS